MSRPPCQGKNCTEELRLASPTGLCGWCERERELDAVGVLVALANDDSGRARSERVDAIDDLRRLDYSDAQVLRARAQAVDGHSVEQILASLSGSNETEGLVAA